MQISEVMTRNAKFVNEKDSVAAAARIMRDEDIGFVPVERDDKMVGTLTDRDIAIRVAADDRSPRDVTAGSVMSDAIYYCFDDQSTEEVAETMRDKQVRRIPVVNREKRLVGIVSLGDLATEAGDQQKTLAGVSAN